MATPQRLVAVPAAALEGDGAGAPRSPPQILAEYLRVNGLAGDVATVALSFSAYAIVLNATKNWLNLRGLPLGVLAMPSPSRSVPAGHALFPTAAP